MKFCWLIFLFALGVWAAPSSVAFKAVQRPHFFEIEMPVGKPDASNPFADVEIIGEFTSPSKITKKVEGFCDSDMGRLYRIRFTATERGIHSFRVAFSQDGAVVAQTNGSFFGIPQTNQFSFERGTNIFYLLAQEPAAFSNYFTGTIDHLIVALAGREKLLNPWIAQRPLNQSNPGFDTSRFNLAHWQKAEELLRQAYANGKGIKLRFYADNLPGSNPFEKHPGSEMERFYIRQAVARFGAYGNIEWE